MTHDVYYLGQRVATADADTVTFAQQIAALKITHPIRRWVGHLALYASLVDAGLELGPYTADAAARWARLQLIRTDEFALLATLPDADLARHFRVPMIAILAARSELGCNWN